MGGMGIYLCSTPAIIVRLHLPQMTGDRLLGSRPDGKCSEFFHRLSRLHENLKSLWEALQLDEALDMPVTGIRCPPDFSASTLKMYSKCIKGYSRQTVTWTALLYEPLLDKVRQL